MRSSLDAQVAIWPVELGDIVADKYRIERRIAAGGMGVVMRAVHLELGLPVAIKFMRSMLAGTAEATERFFREGRALAMLRSEHVARVLDVGRHDDLPFLVLEYLDGQDLATLAEIRGVLSVSEVGWYLLQACEALAEAHRAGIVHRDLKPANLFLTTGADGTPCIKVLDFGISKTRAGSNPRLTTPRGLMGSPLYMAPEQMHAPESVDERADVWALGAIAFELCTGRAPFDADGVGEVCGRVMHADTPPLELPAAAAAPGFERVLHRCLEKDPARRYASVAELAEALAPFAPPFAREHAARAARVLGVMPPKATNTVSTAPIVLGPPTLPPRSHGVTSPPRGRGLMVGAALLVAAGIGGVVLRVAPAGLRAHGAGQREAAAALGGDEIAPPSAAAPVLPAPASVMPAAPASAVTPPVRDARRPSQPKRAPVAAPRAAAPTRSASPARPKHPPKTAPARPYGDRGPSSGGPTAPARPDFYDVRR